MAAMAMRAITDIGFVHELKRAILAPMYCSLKMENVCNSVYMCRIYEEAWLRPVRRGRGGGVQWVQLHPLWEIIFFCFSRRATAPHFGSEDLFVVVLLVSWGQALVLSIGDFIFAFCTPLSEKLCTGLRLHTKLAVTLGKEGRSFMILQCYFHSGENRICILVSIISLA